MASEPILRFAPSPNGYLHLGHAYSALFGSDWAARMGGRFFLRIEDLDPVRSKPEFTAAILKDLAWLGIAWPEPVMVQSERMAIYQEAADRLRKMALLYPCFCSRAEIVAKATGQDPDGAPFYPGTCRHLGKDQVETRIASGDPHQWRLDCSEAVRRTGALSFTTAEPTPLDRPQIRHADPLRWGDVVIQRRDVPASYHLSVVVDDAAQQISHVTRGRDLAAATDIHVLLQFLLGLTSPVYTHHRLILDRAGDKLAKSKASTTLRDLRQEGLSAADVRAQLGFA